MPKPRLQIRVTDRRTGVASDHRFTTGPVRIGREPDNELQLADPHVSAAHARLELDDTGATLHDLGSTNGLRLAGRRLAPHITLAIPHRLRISLGPFDLEILHRPDRDHQTTSGDLPEPGSADLEQLHAHLRELHALHTPYAAARQAFEERLADLVHTLQTAGDAPAARRVLAEFSPRDHAHLLLITPTQPHQSHSESSDLPHLSLPPAPSLTRELALIAETAELLLPGQRPPASPDEARRFMSRLVLTLQTLAAGIGAQQHLRLRQARDLGLVPTDRTNPILTITTANELLAHLLAWHNNEPDHNHELLDALAVLLAHARAHVTATLAATRHLAAELAPPAIELQVATTSPFRSRALWRGFLDRYAACLGDSADTAGTLRDRFRSAYADELQRHGLPLAVLPNAAPLTPSS